MQGCANRIDKSPLVGLGEFFSSVYPYICLSGFTSVCPSSRGKEGFEEPQKILKGIGECQKTSILNTQFSLFHLFSIFLSVFMKQSDKKI